MAEEARKLSDAQKRAMKKYQQKFVHATFNIDKDLRDKVNEYCVANGISMGKLITQYLEMLVSENG